jgi:hypothetical protein
MPDLAPSGHIAARWLDLVPQDCPGAAEVEEAAGIIISYNMESFISNNCYII